MKIQTKTKLILLLFILPIFTIGFVNAQNEIEIEWSKAEFFASNIRVNIPTKKGIKVDIGGYEVGEIRPLGVYDDGEYKIFSAKAYSYFDVQLYTDQTVSTALSGFASTEKQLKWLSLFYGVNVHRGEGSVKTYYAKYPHYYYSAISTNGKGVNEKFDVNVEIVDLTPSALDFGNNQFKITTKSLIGQIDRLTVIDSEIDEIGQYNNYYQSGTEVKLTTTKITQDRVDDSYIPHEEAYKEFVAFVASSDLGVEDKGNPYDATIQQGAITKVPVGKDITDGVDIKIIPDIKQTIQAREVRYQYVAVDTHTAFLGVPAGISEKYCGAVEVNTYKNAIGYKIKNYIQTMTIKVESTLFAQVKIDVFEDSDTPDLEIPDQQLDDYIWDGVESGTTGAEIGVNVSNPVNDFFSGIFGGIGNVIKWIVIIGMIIGLVWVISKLAFAYTSVKSVSNRRVSKR